MPTELAVSNCFEGIYVSFAITGTKTSDWLISVLPHFGASRLCQ